MKCNATLRRFGKSYREPITNKNYMQMYYDAEDVIIKNIQKLYDALDASTRYKLCDANFDLKFAFNYLEFHLAFKKREYDKIAATLKRFREIVTPDDYMLNIYMFYFLPLLKNPKFKLDSDTLYRFWKSLLFVESISKFDD